MATAPWRVPTHGPLTALADGLWTVDAELTTLPIGRRMTISRIEGGLAIHSTIACDEATMTAIDGLGPVRFIIVPSGYHRMDAPAYAARYPEAEVIAMPASHARAGQRVTLAGDYRRLPTAAPLGFEPLDGVPAEAVFIHRAPDGGETLVFNDALMNLPDRLPGFKGWIVKAIGSTGGLKVTGTARLALVKDRVAYAAHLHRLADRPRLQRIVPGHGAIVTTDASAALHRAADRLHRAASS